MTEPIQPDATPAPAPAAATAPTAPPPADKPPAPPAAAGKPAHPKPGGLRAAAKGFSGERVAMPNARSRGDSKVGPPPVDLPDVNFSIRDLDKDLDAELEAAMGGLSSTELYGDLSKQQKRSAAPAGPKIGRVLSVHGADVFVEVPGGRSQGVLPIMHFPDGPPAPGTEVEVHIEGYDPANGLLRLSRQGSAVHVDWGSIAENQIVEGRVTAVNKGGLEVTVNGIRGFMPISQIDLFRVEHPEEYLNQRLMCVVTEANQEERNLVLSRRTLLEKDREDKREKLWAEIAEGQVREGIVRSVRDFGAFVDVGGADGLLHVSEMSWARVADATKVLQTGQTVKVVVLKVDLERRKISLGMKQLQTSPWDAAVATYVPGAVVTGTVTRIMEFGAFVELEPGVEGLLHISELAPTRTRRVTDLVQPEQKVQVKILSVDPGQRRMSLSLKGAVEAAAEAAEEEEDDDLTEAPAPRPRNENLRGGTGY